MYRIPCIFIVTALIILAQNKPTPETKDPITEDELIDATFRVISIGVEPDESKNGHSDPYAYDAMHIAAAIQKAKPCYKKLDTRVIVGQEADKRSVVDALRELAKNTRDKDVSFIHFSTHGEFIENGENEFYFSLAFSGGNQEPDSLAGAELHKILKKMRGTVLVSLDTCCAAGIIPEVPIPNVSFLTASGKKESSYGDGSGKTSPHGFYVSAFLSALKGLADTNTDGFVTFGELTEYIPAIATRLCKDQNAEFQMQNGHSKIRIGQILNTHKTEK